MSIEVNNESGIEVDELALRELSRFVLDKLGIDPLAELSIVLMDSDSMAALHVQWMDIPGPTDVMSFPMDGADSPPDHSDLSGPRAAAPQQQVETLLGDVVLCPEVAATQAKAAGHSTAAELHLLTTHGILHLLGYDHGDAEEEREMFARQTELLAAWSASSGHGPINAPLPGTAGEVRAWAHSDPT
ncbi:probable rRNA maturation factor [Frankineae bacterium MT45]|nr:probable rRNA maturation factor [Frankineae bacterium MT45]